MQSPPIVVDLGKVKAKRIKALKRGEGQLAHEVEDVLANVRASLGKEAEGKEFIPIVMVYRKKRKKRKLGKFPFGF